MKSSSSANSRLERSIGVLAEPGAPGEDVHPEVADPEDGASLLVRSAGQRSHPGEQLFEGEGLGQVVVRPGLKGPDFVLDLVAGRQHQDGQVGTLGADPGKGLVAVETGQHDVEQDDVDRLGRRQAGAVLAAVRRTGAGTVRAQGARRGRRTIFASSSISRISIPHILHPPEPGSV